MSTLTQSVLVAGSDNHPHMLEKSSYDSWQSRMLMYIEGNENGQLLLNSILNGPIKFKEIVDSGNQEAGRTE
nr:hypothetical protein [Tanacetum cinerariifolium]